MFDPDELDLPRPSVDADAEAPWVDDEEDDFYEEDDDGDELYEEDDDEDL